MNDEQLMNRYRDGDHQAFTVLYEKYSPLVYGYVRKRLPSSEVDDFYQTVWRHLHEKRNYFQDQPFAPWFFHIIRNLLVDYYRSLGRNSNFLKRIAAELKEKPIDLSDIRDLFEDLPEDSKVLLQKYFIEGFSYEDIEKETGVSQISLRKRISRAISQMRKKSEV